MSRPAQTAPLSIRRGSTVIAINRRANRQYPDHGLIRRLMVGLVASGCLKKA